jgi:hypothetical protein
MSMLFNEITSWSKAQKPEGAYARYPPGSNSNNCLKLAVFGQKSVKKAVKLAVFCTKPKSGLSKKLVDGS